MDNMFCLIEYIKLMAIQGIKSDNHLQNFLTLITF